jgi:Zn-dependent protease
LNTERFVVNVILVAIFLGVAFPVHEFSHAAVAYMRGDATAKLLGRLTLNPIVHFDRIGGLMVVFSIFFGGFVIGWAKPTPVNTANLKDRRNDEVLVALAGPASNLLMAIIGAFVIRLVVALHISLPGLVEYALSMFVVFNLFLMIFNLIPVPPLDGGTLLFRFLPVQQAWQLRPILAQYGIVIVIAVAFLGARVIADFVYGFAGFLVGA